MSEVEIIQTDTQGIDLDDLTVQPDFDEEEEQQEHQQGFEEQEQEVEDYEMTMKKAKVLRDIKRRLMTFPDKVEHLMLPMPLEYYSLEQLENYLNELRLTISNSNSTSQFLKMVLGAVSGFEAFVVSYTPLKLQGLSNVLAQDQDTEDILKEIYLDYIDESYQDPISRLAMKVMSTSLQVHVMNSMAEKQAAVIAQAQRVAEKMKEDKLLEEKEVDSELIEKYSDL